MLKNTPTLTIRGVDTAENERCKGFSFFEFYGPPCPGFKFCFCPPPLGRATAHALPEGRRALFLSFMYPAYKSNIVNSLSVEPCTRELHDSFPMSSLEIRP